MSHPTEPFQPSERLQPSEPGSGSVRDIYTISKLNREVRALLEHGFPLIWVEGELSNLARPASGHIYFSLKDTNAQIRCAMFKQRCMHVTFKPENGQQVLVRARVGLYEARGDYQLIVDHMEEAGDGALRRVFDELKHKLDKEGLFDPAHKKVLPSLPQRIGVVTSPSGAAVRDVLSILQRRFPSIEVVIYPVPVQGAGSAEQIADMLRLADERDECDVFIIARGGGSLEDLWAFNEEVLARAVYECNTPVVSGVGHEIDFTIADFVADERAATPSAAAELLSPDQNEWMQALLNKHNRLLTLMQSRLQQHGQQLSWLRKRLQDPGKRLQAIAQRLDDLELRLKSAQRSIIVHTRSFLLEINARLRSHTPLHHLQRLGKETQTLGQRLTSAISHALQRQHQQLTSTVRALDAVSPLATLGRGYSIITRYTEGTVVRAASDVKSGDKISARLAKGSLICHVDKTE